MTRLNPGDQPFENLIPLGRMGQTSGFTRVSLARESSADPNRSGHRQRSHVPLLARSIMDQRQCHGTSPCPGLLRAVLAGIDGLICSRQVVDGGDAHTRAPYVPYPEAMFNPKMMTDVLKGKL